MKADQLEILKSKLNIEYVPHLLPLLQPSTVQENNIQKNTSRAYTAFGLSKILGIDNITASTAVVDDFDDNGIDVIFYNQGTKTIYLLQGKLKGNEVFNQNDATNFINGCRDLINQRFERFNANVINRRTYIEEAFDEADHVILGVVHASEAISQHAKDVIENFLTNDILEDDNRLHRDWIDYGIKRAIIDLLNENATPAIHIPLLIKGDKIIDNPQNKVVYGQVSVKALVDLYSSHGNSLFEKNIRFFLGRSDVNDAISNTLRTEPDNFFYLSNGVTAIASQIHAKAKRSDKRLYKFNNFSVINGAQTIASSHSFIATNPDANIDSSYVMMTIIEVDTESVFSEKITKARNHQNRVKTTDFAALDPTQERLRRELLHLGITYRYRPGLSNASTERDFTIDDTSIALALLLPDPNIPVLLKQTPASFTNPDTDNYKRIFKVELSGKALANSVILYMEAIKMLNMNEAGSYGFDKLIYRHSKYVVIWLTLNANKNWLNRDGVMTAEEARNNLSRPLDEWKEAVRVKAMQDLANYKGPLAFFRNQADTKPFVIALRDHNVAQ